MSPTEFRSVGECERKTKPAFTRRSTRQAYRGLPRKQRWRRAQSAIVYLLGGPPGFSVTSVWTLALCHAGCRKDALCQLVVRAVDHLAIQGEDASVWICGECVTHQFGPAHLIR